MGFGVDPGIADDDDDDDLEAELNALTQGGKKNQNKKGFLMYTCTYLKNFQSV